MLKSDLVQTDKHSIIICYGGKISDFYVAQTIYKHVVIYSRTTEKLRDIKQHENIRRN